jgi:hypoxanthine phosphoribosyltransferase
VNARPLSILFSELQIQLRVGELAHEIAAMDDQPELAVPILAGAFVFAADLLRELERRAVSMPTEFLWLRSYGGARSAQSEVRILAGPGGDIQGRHVLVLDGVLDTGGTLTKARAILAEAGARRVTTAVAVDKRRPDITVRADFAAFTDVSSFIVGYGMDDAQRQRALPYIARVN